MDGSTEELERRCRAGDREALAALFSSVRRRLELTIGLRLDPQLRKRVEVADVLQEAWLDVDRRFPEWVRAPAMGLFLWIRFLAVQKLVELHRRHGAQRRDVRRERPLAVGPEASRESLLEHLAGTATRASGVVARAELMAGVRAALEELDEIDREVLVLRHFEELANDEVAELLGITKAGASNRYMRALKRLRGLMGAS